MNNVHAILLVILAMAGFTVEDGFVKALSATIPVGQILLGLGVGSSLIFAVASRIGGHRLFAPEAWRGLFLWRTLTEGIAAICFATALSLVDISVVAAVFQATPLVITMGAALFLGEQVGWRRWSAICIGFIGVLMIIRPGLSVFDPNILWVLGAVLTVAARDLITRKLDASVASTVVSFQGFAALVLAGPLLVVLTGSGWQPMGVEQGTMLLGGVIFGAIGYFGIVVSMRIGEAGAITPFRYTRLVFSLMVGLFIFGERPDLFTLLGAGLIVATGLYTVIREHRLARRAMAQTAR